MLNSSSLKDWLKYIDDIHEKKIDMELSRIFSVAKKLDLLNPAKKVIIITGTNGKGTTCIAIESVLIESGLKVGTYCSPHLISYTERIKINGNNVSELDICIAFNIIESNRRFITLTPFEYGTLAALIIFKKNKLDVAILEVGLGGRHDATNIINSDISVITNINLDHTHFLGNDIESIGYEKSGVFRYKQSVIFGEKYIPKTVLIEAEKLNVSLFSYEKDWYFKIKNNSFIWSSKNYKFVFKDILNIPNESASTALAAIICLKNSNNIFFDKISENFIITGIKKAKLFGRFHIIQKNPCVILDVAHNPSASLYLKKKLQNIFSKKNRKIYAIFSALKDKNISGIISYLTNYVDCWYLVSINNERGLSSKSLSRYFLKLNYLLFESSEKAIFYALRKSNKEDIIIVFGSFYVVSDVLKFFLKKNK